MAGTAEPFEESAPSGPAVRGVLHRPPGGAGDGLVLVHGAGGSARAPLLVAVAERFAAAGLAVLRCDLPFRQARAKGPPRPGEAAGDREGIRRAALALGRLVPGRVFLGGHSYGGRQASMLAAEDPACADALLLLSYPLHPPGRPDAPRTAHLAGIRAPAFFVHGATDPFGSIDEMERARALVPAPTALLPVEGAGHDLGHGGRPSARAATVVERIVEAFVAFVSAPGVLDPSGPRRYSRAP